MDVASEVLFEYRGSVGLRYQTDTPYLRLLLSALAGRHQALNGHTLLAWAVAP